jgi:hypothetical protein
MEVSTSSSTDRLPPKRVRSRVSNGKDLLAGVDQRSAVYRRYRDLIEAIVSDQGGVEECSESRKQLIRRFAACSVLAEQAEAKLAAGQEIDVATHALLTSSLVRVAQRIGIDRRQRNVTPTLETYLRSQYPDDAEAEAEQRVDGARGAADEK